MAWGPDRSWARCQNWVLAGRICHCGIVGRTSMWALVSWRRSVLVVSCSISLATPAGAAAQEPGVVYDPESPAGKEYALPLEEARRDGEPIRPEGRDTSDAQLFGSGIKPKTRASTTGTSPGSGQGGSGRGGAGRGGAGVDGSGTRGGSGTSGKGDSPRGGGRGKAPEQGSVQETIAQAAGTQAWTGGLVGGGAGLMAVFGGLALRRARRSRNSPQP